MKPYAKKRFGQNFLIDPNILRKITQTINPNKNNVIVEIGPGRGALTRHLADSGATIHAIEIDSDLIPDLRTQFQEFHNVIIHHNDALLFDYYSLGKGIRIVGNIPYNISSPLIFKMFENSDIIKDIHFLVQREIAQRICAKPSTKEYGILSVITQYFGNATIKFDVSNKVFRPIPEVTSSLLSISLFRTTNDQQDLDFFRNTVRTAFAKRRKTLRNTLIELIKSSIENCPIDLSRRAESLTVDEFIMLAKWLSEQDTV